MRDRGWRERGAKKQQNREPEEEEEENDETKGERRLVRGTDSMLRQKEFGRGKLCYFSEDLSEVAQTKASGTTSLQPA